MAIPFSQIDDPCDLCREGKPSKWTVPHTDATADSSADPDMNDIMGLVKQAYDYNLQTEVRDVATEKSLGVQEMIDGFRSVLKESMNSLDVAERAVEMLHGRLDRRDRVAQNVARNLMQGEIRCCYKKLTRVCDDYEV